MPLTQKDIAKMVGVAESTVSRAINNKPGVGEKTRKKILEIASKYNYKPNQLAQGLAKQKTHIIALLFSSLDVPSYTKITKSIEKIANDDGYQVILCNTDNNAEKEKSYYELIGRKIVDGAILVGEKLADKQLLNLVLNKNTPIILVNRLIEELFVPTVLIDHNQGGYLATSHLIKQGLNEIAIIKGPQNNYVESEKLEGYYKALKEANIKPDNNYIIETNGKRKNGYQSFLTLMNLNEPPAGFFVTKELLAAGLVDAIKMGGYHIPGDFSVVCYEDSIISSIINPPLTVVSEPLAELGKIAAKSLIKLIRNNSDDSKKNSEKQYEDMIKVLKPEIKVRDSSIPHFDNKNNN